MIKLVALGADVEVRELGQNSLTKEMEDVGITPLVLAVMRQEVELCELLLSLGARHRVEFDGVDLMRWADPSLIHVNMDKLAVISGMIRAHDESQKIKESVGTWMQAASSPSACDFKLAQTLAGAAVKFSVG